MSADHVHEYGPWEPGVFGAFAYRRFCACGAFEARRDRP